MNKALRLKSFNIRTICTSIVSNGKRNFDKFPLYEKRLDARQKAILRTRKGREQHQDILKFIDRGIRPTKMFNEASNEFETVPELIPEIIVPDLTGFNLKPYVSYNTPDVEQGEFTPQDLFQAVYSAKIVEDFNKGKLDENGNSIDPSAEEALTCEEAKINARKTGTDLFDQPYFPSSDVRVKKLY